MRTDEIAAITGEDDPIAALLHKIVNHARAFVETCDIDNYGLAGEMAGEAEQHRRRFGKYLTQLDDLRAHRETASELRKRCLVVGFASTAANLRKKTPMTVRLSPNDDRVIEQREEERACWMDAITETLNQRDDVETLARKFIDDDVVETWLREDTDEAPTKKEWIGLLIEEADLNDLDQHINAEAYAEAEKQQHRDTS